MIIEANDRILRDIVFRMIARSMKDHKVWHLFRYFTNFEGMNNVYRIFGKVDRTKIPCNNFCYCVSINEIKYLLGQIWPWGDNSYSIESILEDRDKTRYLQDRIAGWINVLLHETIENLIPIEKVAKIGEDAYNYSCKNIFGDKFEDLLTNEMPSDLKAVNQLASHGINMPRDFKGQYDTFTQRINHEIFEKLTKELKRIREQNLGMQRYVNTGDMLSIDIDDFLEDI